MNSVPQKCIHTLTHFHTHTLSESSHLHSVCNQHNNNKAISNSYSDFTTVEVCSQDFERLTPLINDETTAMIDLRYSDR